MPELSESEIDRFKGWVKNTQNVPGLHKVETVLIKNGPKHFKSVSLLYLGSSPDNITKRELRFRTSKRDARGGFEVIGTWGCEDIDGAVACLKSFLDTELSGEGAFSLVQGSDDAQRLLDYLASGELNSGFLTAMARALVDRSEIDLSESDALDLVAAAVDLRHRKRVLDELEAVVLDPTSKEADLQRILDANWWLLGGTYIGKVPRRRLTVLDEWDIPLIRADNVLHIVELKRASIHDLVRMYRSHCIVGTGINEAFGQAINYLRTVDEHRANIFMDFGIECRRTQATILIGHPDHVQQDGVTPDLVREAIRTYNAHNTRVEVLTYEDVIVTARNSIKALARQVENEQPTAEPEEVDLTELPVTTTNGWADDEEPF